MSLELDEETREQLGYGDTTRWLHAWWMQSNIRASRDIARGPRHQRFHNDAYKARKRARDAKRIAAKRAAKREAP